MPPNNREHLDEPRVPFFAYGIFKPGQLAYRQIEQFVATTDKTAKVNGALRERDGLPILKIGGTGEVRGVLVAFRADAEAEAYTRINKLEPEWQYCWETVQVFSATDQREAAALIGVSADKGSIPLETNDWDGASDPLFTSN